MKRGSHHMRHLRQLERDLVAKGWKTEAIEELGIPALIGAIEADEDPPALRSLSAIESHS